MSTQTVHFDATFADFRFLQGYMARRLVARNKAAHTFALIGVVLCALFLTLAIVISSEPFAAARLLPAMPYPTSVYLEVIVCLVAAILSLVPAIATRRRGLRMQVSDTSPLLGPTTLTIEDDGLLIERKLMRTKYLWAAFQGVEMARNRVILPIDNGIGLIIPASAFSDEAARYAFAADVSKRIQQSRQAGN
jgi:hypothetical protein